MCRGLARCRGVAQPRRIYHTGKKHADNREGRRLVTGHIARKTQCPSAIETAAPDISPAQTGAPGNPVNLFRVGCPNCGCADQYSLDAFAHIYCQSKRHCGGCSVTGKFHIERVDSIRLHLDRSLWGNGLVAPGSAGLSKTKRNPIG